MFSKRTAPFRGSGSRFRRHTAAFAQIIPNDAHFKKQWALHKAWESETGDSSIIVGIIDIGCKWKHKEFEGRIWKNRREIPGNLVDDDGNG
jgi:hypothetical protein